MRVSSWSDFQGCWRFDCCFVEKIFAGYKMGFELLRKELPLVNVVYMLHMTLSIDTMLFRCVMKTRRPIAPSLSSASSNSTSQPCYQPRSRLRDM